MEEIASSLTRKLDGARHAIECSPDPVSQAASSLVELIDRLLRTMLTDDEVLAWIEAEFPARLDLTFPDAKGRRHPTKFGVALCVSFAGDHVPNEPSWVHELAARALVNVRQDLEGLKHADDGSDAEKELLLIIFSVIEAAIFLICKLAWLSVSADKLRDIRGGSPALRSGRQRGTTR